MIMKIRRIKREASDHEYEKIIGEEKQRGKKEK